MVLEWVLIVLSLIGIADASYISYHAYTGKAVKCLFFPKKWCKKVQYSKYSKTLGIPNGYLGVALYSLIFITTLLFMGEVIAFWPIATLLVIGFLFSVYFTAIQLFALNAFCVYCIISAVNLTTMFVGMLIRHF